MHFSRDTQVLSSESILFFLCIQTPVMILKGILVFVILGGSSLRPDVSLKECL